MKIQQQEIIEILKDVIKISDDIKKEAQEIIDYIPNMEETGINKLCEPTVRLVKGVRVVQNFFDTFHIFYGLEKIINELEKKEENQ